MLKFSLTALWLGLACFLWSWASPSPSWDSNTPLQVVQEYLGEDQPEHYLNPNEALVKKGEELVKIGRTIGPDGKKTKYISKYYACTTCHNLEIEDPDLRVSDPETRLEFAKANNLLFFKALLLRGSSIEKVGTMMIM